MMEIPNQNLKPQDILILSKFLVSSVENIRIQDIALELGISASEVSVGIRRLQGAKLLQANSRIPLRENAFEFLVHGFKYVFPVRLGPVALGIATSHSYGKLKEELVSSNQDSYVWACEFGNIKGHSVKPIYSSVPKAILSDPKLHEILALIDAFRVGRVREQVLAKTFLSEIIFNGDG